MSRRGPGRPVGLARAGAAACALGAALLGACSVSPERCDPSDPSFGLSLVCQEAYRARRETLRAEVERAGRRTEALETEREAIAGDRAAIAEALEALEARARATASRLEALRRDGRSSEAELAALGKRLSDLETELASLGTERRELERDGTDPELAERVERLRAEEEELERLLLDLET